MKILMAQVTDNVLGADGLVPALQRDLEHSFSRANTTEGSKMGSLTNPGSVSETISCGFLFKSNDEGQLELKRAMKEGKEVKIWIIDTTKVTIPGAVAPAPTQGYKTDFAYCVLGELSYSYPYEGVEEVTSELTVQIISQEGYLTELPDGIVDFAGYGFETPGEYTGDHVNRTDV